MHAIRIEVQHLWDKIKHKIKDEKIKWELKN